MFAPTKIWRRWHRKININQKRYALASALAASAIPALVLARGHRVEQVPEIPLVIDTAAISNVDKTAAAIKLLKAVNAFADVEKAKDSKKLRAGVGKMRNRRYSQRRGPLVIFNEKGPLAKSFRNLPGVELASVSRLNLLQLAPGGHLGRFCIWTKDAFSRLDSIYGTYKKPAAEKTDYSLPRAMLSNADLSRIINSEEVQSALREKIPQQKVHVHRKNPLKNLGFRIKLNPHARTATRRELLAKEQRDKKRKSLMEAKRKGTAAPAPDKKTAAAVAKTKSLRKNLKKSHLSFRKKLLAEREAKKQ